MAQHLGVAPPPVPKVIHQFGSKLSSVRVGLFRVQGLHLLVRAHLLFPTLAVWAHTMVVLLQETCDHVIHLLLAVIFVVDFAPARTTLTKMVWTLTDAYTHVVQNHRRQNDVASQPWLHVQSLQEATESVLPNLECLLNDHAS